MINFAKIILVTVLCLFVSGCTIHFKGKEIELDVERQRVDRNITYELEKVCVLDG